MSQETQPMRDAYLSIRALHAVYARVCTTDEVLVRLQALASPLNSGQ